MIISVGKKGTVEELDMLIAQIQESENIEGILVLSCDANDFTPQKVNAILNKISMPIFGGIFPQIISGVEKLEQGTIVVGLEKKPNVVTVPDLSDMNAVYDEILDEKITDSTNTKTMFVFVDGFASRINSLIESLFNVFGLSFNYIGGGAGSLSFKQKPCLFTNQGLVEDAAVLALLENTSGIGVSHGWKSISGPYKVTESEKNIIKTLDGKRAFDLYKEIVEKHSGKKFTDDNFFDIAKSYPFGINKIDAEKIVRDPILIGEKNSLLCVGEIPQQSYVDILTGDFDSLIQAASNALDLSDKAFPDNSDKECLFFIDCISRVLFLEEKFEDELKVVDLNKIPKIGALTIGEIANSGFDFLEFYNKTSVVGLLGK